MATATAHEQVVQTLNELIETCKDGEKGFTAAAAAAKSFDLKQLLQAYASQRALFATELQSEVQRLGGQPEESGSFGGSLHRGWMNFKALVTGAGDCAIITECERGEEAAVKAYEESLKDDLPPALKGVIQRQFEHVQEASARLHALQCALA
jgi:uncharacterized protein (TIGR02284 family)